MYGFLLGVRRLLASCRMGFERPDETGEHNGAEPGKASAAVPVPWKIWKNIGWHDHQLTIDSPSIIRLDSSSPTGH
ncbi:hypothetical protein [Thiomonas sp.]